MIKKQDFTDNTTVLIIEDATKLQALTSNIVKILQTKTIIYVTVSKPHTTIISNLKKANIRTDNIFFIDCIGRPLATEEQKNASFVNTPSDLTGIAILLTKIYEDLPQEKYVIIDMLSTMTVYTKEEIVIRFTQSIIEKATRNNAKIIALTTADTALNNRIAPFFEKVIQQ